MTEIPEHLLKRSQERKAALTGEAPADDAPAAGTAVEAAAAAAPAPVAAAAVPDVAPEPEPPAPVAPYVQQALNRKKMPYWIVPVLLCLPVWGMMYLGTLERVPQGLTGLLGHGEELYVEAGCSGCHGAEGGGGIGPQISDGEVHVSFTSLEDQIVWMAKGSALVQTGNTYTSADSERPRAVAGQMPGFGSEGADALTAEEILSIALYVRTQKGNEDSGTAERDLLLTQALDTLIDAGEIEFPESFAGATLTAEDVAGWIAPGREALAAAEG